MNLEHKEGSTYALSFADDTENMRLDNPRPWPPVYSLTPAAAAVALSLHWVG